MAQESKEQAGAKLRYSAAGLAFAAELIHLLAFTHEFAIFPTRGLPLLPVAAVQGALAVSLLFGSGRWTLLFGILFNLAVVFGWALTRTVGVPSGEVLMQMPVGGLDLAATAAEVALLVLLMRLRRQLPPKKRKRRVRWAHAQKCSGSFDL